MSNNIRERNTRQQIKKYRIILAIAILFIIFAQTKFGGTGDTEQSYVEYTFRNREAKMEHYEKHGIEMGFKSADAYEAAASAVVNNPASLHKLEAEDNDDVYYLEETNEFVIVSTYGYIRTYFKPDRGKAYFDAQ